MLAIPCFHSQRNAHVVVIHAVKPQAPEFDEVFTLVAIGKGQEVVLAIRLQREGFDEILSHAVPSTYWRHRYETEADWKQRLAASNVRLQWDPDHHPSGAKLERRAIQLSITSSYPASSA